MPDIQCPNCGTSFEVNTNTLVAACPFCENVVFTSENAAEIGIFPEPTKEKRKKKIYDSHRPEKLQVEATDKGLRISWSWLSPEVIFLIFFAVFWNGIVWTIAGSLFDSGGFFDGPFVFFLFVPGIHLIVGIGLIYGILTMLFNRTTVIVNHNTIVTHTRPIPIWDGYKEFYATDIEQLYVKRTAHNSKNGTKYSYLVLVLRYGDDKPQKLLHSLQNAEYALYLEREIEAFLGIENRHIGGSYTG